MNDLGLTQGITLSLALVYAGILGLSVTRAHRDTLRLQYQLLVVAFVVRFAFALALYEFGLIDVMGDCDSSGWVAGVSMHDRWLRAHASPSDLPSLLMPAFSEHHRGYYYMLAVFFYFTHCPVRLAAAALNCFFGALTVVYAYRVARSLFSEWVANQVARWTCFFPSMIIWSAMTQKEPVVILLETIALYACVRLRKDGLSPGHVLLCLCAIVLLVPFRFYAAYIVGAAVLVSLMMPGFGRIQSGLAVAAVLGGVFLVVPPDVVSHQEAEFEVLDLDRAQDFREAVATGGNGQQTGSGVQTEDDLRTPRGLILGTAVGGAHLLLAPFPWQLRGGSARMLLTTPELVYWWWLFFAGVLPGLRYGLRHHLREIAVLLFFIAGFGLIYSMMFGNIGLVFRQRAQLLPWLFILGGIGLEQRRLRRAAEERRESTPPSRLERIGC